MCESTKGEWEAIGTGASVSLTEAVTYSSTRTYQDQVTITASAKATSKMDFGLGDVSVELGLSVATSITNTYSNTVSGTKSNTYSVNCPLGTVYQWRLVQPSVTILTNNFVCVDSSIPEPIATPACPPTYCNLHLDCQCCNSNTWAQDPANGKLCI